MSGKIMQEIEQAQMKTDIPKVNVGDTVRVANTIVEGKKKRTQFYEGLVIKSERNSNRECVTVRKIVDGVGVEKTFLLHSPLVEKIDVLKAGKVRRAKLHYLRERVGAKATRVKSADVKPVKATKA